MHKIFFYVVFFFVLNDLGRLKSALTKMKYFSFIKFWPVIAKNSITNMVGHKENQFDRALRTVMIVDLLKFGIIFFLPTIIGKTFKLFQDLKKKEFSILSWKKQRFSHNIINIVVLIYIITKLSTIFVFGSENFFSKIEARIDSPSYIIRNHYRAYIENWAEHSDEIKEFIKLKDVDSISEKIQQSPSYKSFSDFQALSEQLKIKDNKAFYSKYGEYAFLNCQYCTTDSDYAIFLAPRAIFEYSLFLILAGVLTSISIKSNWRFYGIITALITLALEAYAFIYPTKSITSFELYDGLFGDDMFTLRYEKIAFTREIIFIIFLMIALIFDNGKDLRIKSFLDQTRKSLETSLAFLQATRIQRAAISVDENLQKFVNDSIRSNKSKLSSITSDPGFRQKVVEMGHKLNIEEMLSEKNKKIDELLDLLQDK